MQPHSSIIDPLATEYVRFARLVCSTTGDEDHPIQRLGSGVVIMIEGDYYLLTARHIFTNNQANPHGVVIPFMDNAMSWWSTNACVHLGATEPYTDDDTYGDLAVYSLETPPNYEDKLCKHDYLPIPGALHLESNSPLFAFGYPDEGSDLDPELRILGTTLNMIKGAYTGSTNYTGIHTFHSEHLGGITPNGMSGGPITTLDPNQIGRHLLVGIIVQSSDCSVVLHFIGLDMIKNALEYAIPKLRRLRTEGPFIY